MSKSKFKIPKIYISYTHSDNPWAEQVISNLHATVKPQKLDIWSDQKIKAGSKWLDEIKNAIQTSELAVLLISAGFLASDFIVNHELPFLLKRAKKEGMRIIPVLISPISPALLGEIREYQFINWDNPLSMISPEKRISVLEKLNNNIIELIRPPKTCFLLTPFSEDFKFIRSFIADILRDFDVKPILLENFPSTSSSIFEVVQDQIKNSDFLIADLTGNNPNVMYELGIAHSLKKPTLIIVQDKDRPLPFDISSQLFIKYNTNAYDLEHLRNMISKWIPRLIAQSKKEHI